MVVPIIIIVLLYVAFISYHRDQRIIKDTGYSKIILVSVGFILYLLSIFLVTYTTNIECTLNLLLKHVGISLILFVYYIYITQSYILGIQIIKATDGNKNNPNNVNNFVMSVGSMFNFEKQLNKIDDKYKSNDDINKGKNDEKSSVFKANSEFKFSKNVSLMNSDNVNTVIYIKEKEAYSLLVEATFVYIIYIIIITGICLYHMIKYGNELEIIQNNKYWIYRCNLNHTELILNLLTFLFLIVLLIRGKKSIVNENIFVCIKYITYSTFVVFTLGPLINVNYININCNIII